MPVSAVLTHVCKMGVALEKILPFGWLRFEHRPKSLSLTVTSFYCAMCILLINFDVYISQINFRLLQLKICKLELFLSA